MTDRESLIGDFEHPDPGRSTSPTKELLQAAEKVRRAVLELDLALTDLIGTEGYPDELTTLHLNLRDAAVLYDVVKTRPRA